MLILFHNLSYDGSFLLQFLQENSVKPTILTRGLRILQIEIPKLEIVVKDSYAFLPMALAGMPKAFGLPSGPKGCFPFLFCSEKNLNYVGKIPERNFFFTHTMSQSALEEFQLWHSLQQKSPDEWNFKKEMLKYCEQDCQILRQACLLFAGKMRELTGFCPFTECVTLPSYVNLVFRAQFMPQNSIALIGQENLKHVREVSTESIEWLNYLQVQEDIKIQHGYNGGEERLGKFRVDGICFETNTVFEYNGCLFHGCPKCYDGESVNFEGHKMKDLLARTRRKQRYLEGRGFSYREIWACEWNQLKKASLEVSRIVEGLDLLPPLDVRQSLFGGRCEPFILKQSANNGARITYKDITSLYPAVCAQEKFPLYHPEVIREDFKDIQNYFGLAHVTVLPPRRLAFPVLPVRLKEKTCFTLCSPCFKENHTGPCPHDDKQREIVGVYTTEELKLALEHGYTLQRIHEIWHFAEKSGELFKQMIKKFYVLKVANSGWPKEDMTPREKSDYLRLLKERDMVELTEDDIADNPLMRLLAKLILNSLWGRFALRANRTKFEYVSSSERFQELVFSGHHDISWLNFVSDDLVQVQHQASDDIAAFDPSGSIIIASFVTSYARIRLYRAMAYVGPERLLYVDTDCVVALEEAGYSGLPTGGGLGEFKDELKEGTYIMHWACGAPKTYCYVTSDLQVVFKHKGIPINFSNKKIFTLDTLHKMLEDRTYIETVLDPHKIFRIKGSWKVISKKSSKFFRFTFDKRQIVDSFFTLPHGYY